MADTLVSAVVETVLGILASATLQEIGGVWGLKDELNKLASTFVTIQLVLQDAEIKQRKNEAIQHWLRELKNAACDAENILDRMETEGLLRTLDSEKGIHHKLKSFFSSRNQLIFRLRFEMAREVKSIRRKLDAIAEVRLNFHLGEGVMENRFGVTIDSRQTGSLVNESEIFGRHEEKEMIVEKLVNVTLDQYDPCVYAIQGMGGLGKTTLAQMVYNDERAERHFERRIWVCVSDDFSIQSILTAMIESIDGSGCNISTLDPLQRRLQERLMGQRFLLVLDDVWNESHRLWDGLRDVLRYGSKGSVLMVTTRIEKVAMMMATIDIHHIEYLTEVDSWSVFRQRAFATGEGEVNLVVIGKAIVKKCGGVPLAIKALGGLMRFKSNESEWSAIKESEIWQLPEDETGILPALRLSYDNLLPQMRQCFVYCCIFPKDKWMDENQLIELWMANGFLYNIGGQTDIKLTGHLILKELAWRSLLQLEVDYLPGMITKYKMHDLMHDLASSVMRHETFILEHGKVLKIPKTLRHLFFSRSWKVPDGKLKLPVIESLHSIIVQAENTQSWGQDFSTFLSKQRYVRALDMNCGTIEKLPNLVCNFVHLRYLAMSCRNIKKLPDSLTRLQNLQTLKLNDSTSLLELPAHLKVMKNLWFLDLDFYGSLLCTPPGLGELTRLRRLSVFIVGEDASHHVDQLRELNLSGHLSIQGLDKVMNLKDAKSANLMSKKDLTSLTFSWKNGTQNNSPQHFEEVLQGLQPHRNLNKICIVSYQGSIFPNWMSSNLALKELKEIFLYNCRRCELLPAFGLLPSLTRLLLDGLDSIKHLVVDLHGHGECSFPVLTSLALMNLPNLEEWAIDDSGKGFLSLKHLSVERCPKLTRLNLSQVHADMHGHRKCSFPVLTSLTIADLPNLEGWAIDDPGKGCPSLEHLKVQRCPKLNRLPKSQSLTNLTIWDCSDALLTSIMFLTSLTSLRLHGLPELQVFPEGFLQNHRALKSLIISGLPAIRTLSNILDNLTALNLLHLRFCTNLELLPEGLKHLSSLERLQIIGCDCLKSFPATILESLPSLRSLSFMSCMNLIPLTGSLNRAPAALQVLMLTHLPEIEYLPNCLWELDSLSVISIQICEKLKSLPDDFNSLKSLRELEIRGCPQLEKRCKKPMGEDWPKISDIPCIKINGEVIYTTLG